MNKSNKTTPAPEILPLYLTALAITELPYAIASVYLGESFLEGESTVFILPGIAVAVFGVLLVRMIRKYINRMRLGFAAADESVIGSR